MCATLGRTNFHINILIILYTADRDLGYVTHSTPLIVHVDKGLALNMVEIHTCSSPVGKVYHNKYELQQTFLVTSPEPFERNSCNVLKKIDIDQLVL